MLIFGQIACVAELKKILIWTSSFPTFSLSFLIYHSKWYNIQVSIHLFHLVRFLYFHWCLFSKTLPLEITAVFANFLFRCVFEFSSAIYTYFLFNFQVQDENYRSANIAQQSWTCHQAFDPLIDWLKHECLLRKYDVSIFIRESLWNYWRFCSRTNTKDLFINLRFKKKSCCSETKKFLEVRKLARSSSV